MKHNEFINTMKINEHLHILQERMNTIAMKIISKLFRTHYRLSVQFRGDGFVRHVRHTSRKHLRKMAKNLANVESWTLYKTGPFFLPERHVDYGEGRKQ
jgi:hypothetical protein